MQINEMHWPVRHAVLGTPKISMMEVKGLDGIVHGECVGKEMRRFRTEPQKFPSLSGRSKEEEEPALRAAEKFP